MLRDLGHGGVGRLTPDLPDFVGAKVALFCGDRVLVCLRDDVPHIPWPGHWDLPGGGREGQETAEDCLLRELHEEFGLRLPPARLILRRVLPSLLNPARPSVFFAGHLSPAEIAAIRFGDEGQGWKMMEVAAFLSHPRGVPGLQDRTRDAWAALRPAG